jgi:hypothetical protein
MSERLAIDHLFPPYTAKKNAAFEGVVRILTNNQVSSLNKYCHERFDSLTHQNADPKD